MDHKELENFVSEWAEAWNRRDIEAVLKHFHEDILFTSPTALAVVGSPTVHGKGALRSYWTTAISRIHSLHFTIDRVLWDSEHRELAIIYRSEIDGRTKRVSENLTLNEDGQVVVAEVFHGIGQV